jgi:ubiquinone/menaquinone biosynthesis C-methylase UbiE
MNQEDIWNNIAREWKRFRDEPREEVVNFLKKEKGKILDLGSGSGRHLIKIQESEMYLVDFSKEMINLAEKKAKEKKIKAKFFISSLISLPFRDNFFDSAIFISSLHCIKGERNRKKAVKELFRVLKPEKRVLISVWNKNSRRFKNSPKEKIVRWRDKGARYYYLFEKKEIYDLFKEVGFKINKKIKSKENIIFTIKKPDMN